MARSRITLETVIEVMDKVIAGTPAGADSRVGRKLGGRYAEHGKPCCLVGVMLIEFGASVATLKELDREAKWIEESVHPYWRRFEPLALSLLAFLQRQNDSGDSWEEAALAAFTGSSYWRDLLTGGEAYYLDRVFRGRPWLTADKVRKWS
jgi:hypothetical protein